MTSTAAILALGADEPNHEFLLITPKDARDILDKANVHNRRIRRLKVAEYARDMTAGNWRNNGETLKFAKDGTLLDGQHRLLAVLQADISMRFLVVTGLDNVAQETMDDGARRKLADVLTLRGEINATLLAATTRRALMWTQGVMRRGSATATKAECLQFLDSHPELRASVRVAITAATNGVRITGSLAALTHWVFNQIDPEDTAWFFDRLNDGANLDRYHPVMTLRKRMEENAVSATKLPDDAVLAYVIKAWNAYRDGDELRLLRFKPGGAQPEKFPMPH